MAHPTPAGRAEVLSNITLSVVSHGHGTLLKQLLDDLDACDSLAGTRVLITLNLPGEALEPRAYRRIVPVVIRNKSPAGFGANHNAAFRHCGTPWFAVLNPDLRVETDVFPGLVQAAESDGRVAAASPSVVNPRGDIEDHVRANLTLTSLLRRRRGIREQIDTRAHSALPGRFYWLAGMFVVFRASAYRAIGGFDERYFLYCEDYDICARLCLAGHALAVDPRLQVVHDARRDSHRSLRHLKRHVVSLLKVWCSSAFWRVTLRAKVRPAVPVA
jgi:GT2 family glycosyltransferase